MSAWLSAPLLLALAALPVAHAAQPPSPAPAPASTPASSPPSASPVLIDWKSQETLLTNQVQLTFSSQFTRAGEAYFDHQSPPAWIVFQATPTPTPTPPSSSTSNSTPAPSPHYAMYLARLKYDQPGPAGTITGIEAPVRISPPGSANTCAWFSPTDPDSILFASTITPPSGTGGSGFQRGTSTYRWDFPPEMRMVTRSLAPLKGLAPNLSDQQWGALQTTLDAAPPTDLLPTAGTPSYTAECSFDARAANVIYTHVDPETKDADLWVYHLATKQSTCIVAAKGYDGGPFFSPDSNWICYRSDRKGDNNLQLFIAQLAFDDPAHKDRVTGIRQEVQITAEPDVVNWAPFWHPSGQWLIYASSKEGHRNYELFAIDVRTVLQGTANAKTISAQPLPTKRVSHATGFDGLPAFDASGSRLIFTSQRAGAAPGEQRPTSQVWVATVRSPFK